MSRLKILKSLHMGLRILKTGLAVALCLIVCRFFDVSPFFAMIAAIISLKTTHEDSVKAGVNRVFGTIIGGLVGMLVLYAYAYLGVENRSWLYDSVAVLVLMVLIKGLSMINRPSAVVISAVVFLSLLYFDAREGTIFAYSINRVIETALGVVIAIVLNRFMMPYDEDIS